MEIKYLFTVEHLLPYIQASGWFVCLVVGRIAALDKFLYHPLITLADVRLHILLSTLYIWDHFS